MEKIEVTKPMDLFVAFEIWSTKLKTLQNDHYHNYVCAYQIMEYCTIICHKEYQVLLGGMFPTNETLRQSIENIELIAQYKQERRSLIRTAHILVERVMHEQNDDTKREMRKFTSGIFARDPEIQDVIHFAKTKSSESFVSFKKLRYEVRNLYRRTPLLQQFKIESIGPLTHASPS